MGNLPPYLQFMHLNSTSPIRVHAKHQYIPPDAAARNTQAPFLFKFCRVDYNKETNRLEICKGEYVGKVVAQHRDMDDPGSEDDAEFEDILVATDQTDLSAGNVKDTYIMQCYSRKRNKQTKKPPKNEEFCQK